MCFENSQKPQSYIAEIRNFGSSSVIGESIRIAAQFPEKYVLVAEYISQTQAEKLRELNLTFFDTAGNTILNSQNCTYLLAVRKLKLRDQEFRDIFRPPGMKLLHAFLTTPDLEKM